MKPQESETKFQQFQQEMYASFNKRADTAIELIDALCGFPEAESPVQLTLSPEFHWTYTALLRFAQRRDIPPERIVYFGDSLNDLPVFRALPHAVAMGNARQEVKELAWHIAPSNEENGVARMLVALFPALF